MQSMSRSVGKIWRKGPGDNAKVSVLLHDYEDVDSVLQKMIECIASWKNSWVLLVNSQLQIVTEYEGLYDPIVGASDGHGRPTARTPALQLHRTYNLKKVYADLRNELFEEIQMIDEKLTKPATDARDCINPLRKTIKKRESKRLDYEKAQEKVNKLYRKPGRSPKEDASLAKLQDEMARASEAFGAADEHLRQTLPPIIEAAFSLVPPLLAEHVLIQNRLLGLYYTTLHGYSEDNNFPSPPPPMEDVIAVWSAAFKPIQGQMESIPCIARGKAAHQPMGQVTDYSRKPTTPAPTQTTVRRSTSGLIPGATMGQPRTLRVPSMTSLQAPSPPASEPSRSREPSPGPPLIGGRRVDYLTPTNFTQAVERGGGSIEHPTFSPRAVSPGRSPGRSPNSLRPVGDDYFGNRRPSTASTIASSVSQSSTPMATITAAKKKPPPPPPPKRMGTNKQEEFVVALYTFSGQGRGDLSFREGDRIRIVKKTHTDQDWWEGELNGVKGNFPANYCRAA